MLEIATPDLYRSNAFRVLELPVNVSSGDLAKQQTRMKMLGKLGAEASQAQPAILPLEPPPDAEAIRKAAHRLHDPESRIVDELFWFWPLDQQDSEGDSGLRSMRQGDLGSAHRLWCQLEQDGKHRSAAAHNLAVLHHARALDIEHALEDGTHPDPKSVAHRDNHWQVALRHWAAVADDEAVWDRVAARIRELDDPRLTTGVARRLRRTLPIVVLTISIRLAVSSAKQGDADAARRHASYVHDSGLDSSLTAAILDREVAPLVDQIKQACDPVSAKSKADPEHADELAQHLMSDTKPLLSTICAMLDEDHYLRQSAMDIVAGTVLACVRAFGEKSGSLRTCSDLLGQALSMAVSDDLREQIQADKTTVVQIEQSSEIAQFCEAAVAAAEANRAAADGEASQVLRDAPALIARLQQSGLDEAAISQARDMIAMTAMQCAVIHGNATERWPACLEVLRECLHWAVSQQARGKIEENLHSVEKITKFGDLQPIESAPSLSTTYGCGFTLYGRSDYDAETGSYMATYYLVLLAIPIFPIRRYRVVQSGTSTRFFGKARLRQGDKIHLGVSIGIILLLIAIGLISSASGSRDTTPRSAPPSYYPTPAYSPPQPVVPPPPQLVVPPAQPPVPPPTYGYSGLSSRIETGKARAKAFEAEIAKLDSELESFSGRIRGYKQDIEGYERQIRLGEPVNRSLYQQAISNHNLVVDLYSITATQRSDKYAEYRREIDSVNDMVRRFNSGER